MIYLGMGSAQADGFIEDAKGVLNMRNLYFQRDYTGSSAPVPSRANWGQGFNLQVTSGYTPGVVGFGAEVIAKYGMRLDGGAGQSGLNVFPRHDDGSSAQEFGRIGGAVKVRLAHSEVKMGEQLINTPVLRVNDARLLPQTYRGITASVREFDGLAFYAGQLTSFSGRDSSELEKPHIHASKVTSDRFSYAGFEWEGFDKRLQVAYWRAELKDIYAQDFYRVAYVHPLSTSTLRLEAGLYSTHETGAAFEGDLQNKVFWNSAKWSARGHGLTLGYQQVIGDDDLIVLQDSGTMLVNHANLIFAFSEEKSWQLRYDFDLAVLGAPGLSFMTRYIKGWNVKRQGDNTGTEWERDVLVKYVIQSGAARDLNFALGFSSVRSTFQNSFDEIKFSVNYPLSF